MPLPLEYFLTKLVDDEEVDVREGEARQELLGLEERSILFLQNLIASDNL